MLRAPFSFLLFFLFLRASELQTRNSESTQISATDILNLQSLSTQLGSTTDLLKTHTSKEAFIDLYSSAVFVNINVLGIKDESAKTNGYSGSSESVDFTPRRLFTSLAHVPRLRCFDTVSWWLVIYFIDQ